MVYPPDDSPLPLRHQLRILAMAALLAWLSTGCFWPADKVIYEGTHNGLDFVVKVHETRTWNGSRFDWILKLDGHPELPIIITQRRGTPVEPDGVVSTDWGPPYSDAIYGKFDRMYLGNAPAYSNAGDDYRDSVARQHDYTMLYMPLGSDVKDFAAYSALMKAEWTKVDKALASSDDTYFPHLIGLVCASRERFIQRFRGSKDGMKRVLRINPDGFVNFNNDDISDSWNNVRHSPVQMPEKAILVHTIYGLKNDGWQLADVRTMKAYKGKPIKAYFTLKE